MDCLFRCEGQLHLMLTAWLRGKADVRSHIARVVPALDSCFPLYTAIWSKVVGKSACDNPERLWGHCSLKKFERMVRKATDICLRVLKESNKSRFDSFSRYEQCIDHIPYYLSGLSRAHFFRQPFSKQLYAYCGVYLRYYSTIGWDGRIVWDDYWEAAVWEHHLWVEEQ